jgi:hypothetical protein
LTRVTRSHRDYAGFASGRAENRSNSFDFAASPQNQTKKKEPSLLPQAKQNQQFILALLAASGQQRKNKPYLPRCRRRKSPDAASINEQCAATVS